MAGVWGEILLCSVKNECTSSKLISSERFPLISALPLYPHPPLCTFLLPHVCCVTTYLLPFPYFLLDSTLSEGEEDSFSILEPQHNDSTAGAQYTRGGTDNKLNTHPFDKMDNGVKSNGAFVSGIWLALSGTTGVRSE